MIIHGVDIDVRERFENPTGRTEFGGEGWRDILSAEIVDREAFALFLGEEDMLPEIVAERLSEWGDGEPMPDALWENLRLAFIREKPRLLGNISDALSQ